MSLFLAAVSAVVAASSLGPCSSGAHIDVDDGPIRYPFGGFAFPEGVCCRFVLLGITTTFMFCFFVSPKYAVLSTFAWALDVSLGGIPLLMCCVVRG